MIIRQASEVAFQKMALTAFEDEMVKHCREFAPTICKPLSREQLRSAIRHGMAQAQTKGFTRRGSVQFYLDTMLLFGSGFATDPQYPQFAEALGRDDFEFEMQKAEELFDVVKERLEHVAGTDYRYTRGCLRRLLRLLEGDVPVQKDSFAIDMLRIFDEVHPDKSQAAGPIANEAIVRQAVERARDGYGFTGLRSVAVFAILMWFCGHDCDQDPFRPWIRETLTNPTIQGTEAVGVQLEKRAIAFFEAYLQELV